MTTGLGAIRFVLNIPPENGTCTIDKTNGTTMTPFQINCLNWFDTDGIADYTFYGMFAYNVIRQGKNEMRYYTTDSLFTHLWYYMLTCLMRKDH